MGARVTSVRGTSPSRAVVRRVAANGGVEVALWNGSELRPLRVLPGPEALEDGSCAWSSVSAVFHENHVLLRESETRLEPLGSTSLGAYYPNLELEVFDADSMVPQHQIPFGDVDFAGFHRGDLLCNLGSELEGHSLVDGDSRTMLQDVGAVFPTSDAVLVQTYDDEAPRVGGFRHSDVVSLGSDGSRTHIAVGFPDRVFGERISISDVPVAWNWSRLDRLEWQIAGPGVEPVRVSAGWRPQAILQSTPGAVVSRNGEWVVMPWEALSGGFDWLVSP